MTYIKLYRREVNAGGGDAWLFSMPLTNLCSRRLQGHWQHGWLEPEAAAATQKGSHGNPRGPQRAQWPLDMAPAHPEASEKEVWVGLELSPFLGQ